MKYILKQYFLIDISHHIIYQQTDNRYSVNDYVYNFKFETIHSKEIIYTTILK